MIIMIVFSSNNIDFDVKQEDLGQRVSFKVHL